MKYSHYNQVPSVKNHFYPSKIHRNSNHFTSKQNYFTYITSVHSTSLHLHHFTYLHSIPTWIPLLLTTFLILFLSMFSLQWKEDSKPAGNWLQLLMVLFTKKYLLTSVVCLFPSRYFPIMIRPYSGNMVLELYPLSLSKPVPQVLPQVSSVYFSWSYFSSGIWYRVTEWLVPQVSSVSLNFKGRNFSASLDIWLLKLRPLRCFEM